MIWWAAVMIYQLSINITQSKESINMKFKVICCIVTCVICEVKEGLVSYAAHHIMRQHGHSAAASPEHAHLENTSLKYCKSLDTTSISSRVTQRAKVGWNFIVLHLCGQFYANERMNFAVSPVTQHDRLTCCSEASGKRQRVSFLLRLTSDNMSDTMCCSAQLSTTSAWVRVQTRCHLHFSCLFLHVRVKLHWFLQLKHSHCGAEPHVMNTVLV